MRSWTPCMAVTELWSFPMASVLLFWWEAKDQAISRKAAMNRIMIYRTTGFLPLGAVVPSGSTGPPSLRFTSFMPPVLSDWF